MTNLAVNQQVAASTQNQALNAILFLYQKVLGIEIIDVSAVRASAPRNLHYDICTIQELLGHKDVEDNDDLFILMCSIAAGEA